MVLVVKTLPANAGDIKDVGLIPVLRRYLEEDRTSHSGILAWRIEWTDGPGGLQSTESQRVRHD